MIIKERQYKTCGSCNSRSLVADEEHGCDSCRTLLGSEEYLSATIFSHTENATKELHFCSWTCLFSKMPKVKTDHFITLPYLDFDADTPKGQRAQDFFKAVRAFK